MKNNEHIKIKSTNVKGKFKYTALIYSIQYTIKGKFLDFIFLEFLRIFHFYFIKIN